MFYDILHTASITT